MLVRTSRTLSFLARHVAAFSPFPLTFNHWGEFSGGVGGCKAGPPGSVGLRDIASQAPRPFLWLVDAEEPPQLF